MTQEFVMLPREVVELAIETLLCTDSEEGSTAFEDELEAVKKIRAALKQPQNHVPDAGNMMPASWKLVPVEPTKEMLAAACRDGVDLNGRPVWKHTVDVQAAWRWGQMLAAAPQPPTVKECLTVEQPQADQPAMTPIAQRKLDSLLAEGYTISGYSVYHDRKHQHGFVTSAGLVGWWRPDGVEYPQPRGEQDPVADVTINVTGSKTTVDIEWNDLLPLLPAGIHQLYINQQPNHELLTDEAKAAIDAARAAMDESTESYSGRGDISIPSELAAALSLRLDEYDRTIEAAHNIK